MAEIFHRTGLAREMAARLLKPSVLDEGLRSGLFISGVRRTGKTTFLLSDLVPALQEAGAIVIYVDLWSNVQASPSSLVHNAIRSTLAALQTPGSKLLKQLAKVRSAEISAGGLKLGFKLETVGTASGPTLAEAFTQVVDQTRTDIVLIIDEVQQALSSEEGGQMLLALKAARDAVNPRPSTPGHFLFVGTGSHRAMVNELSTRRNQAFAGAISIAYPVLGDDYVQHLLGRLQASGVRNLPSVDAASRAFRTLGNRPEELLRALRTLSAQLPNVPGDVSVDTAFMIVANTLRASAADVELAKVEQIGALALAVFERIAGAGPAAKGLFAADALAQYGKALGRDVRADEVQAVLAELMAANLIMRSGHGLYGLTDPFVQEIWLERQQMQLQTGER